MIFAAVSNSRTRRRCRRFRALARKTAERLIIEMRDRIDRDAGVASVPVSVAANARKRSGRCVDCAGLQAKEVNSLIARLDMEDKSAEDIIRHGAAAGWAIVSMSNMIG